MTSSDINRTLNSVNRLASAALAWEIINMRSIEAHEYAQKYLIPVAWGENIWHAILDDAIRMRNELK